MCEMIPFPTIKIAARGESKYLSYKIMVFYNITLIIYERLYSGNYHTVNVTAKRARIFLHSLYV